MHAKAPISSVFKRSYDGGLVFEAGVGEDYVSVMNDIIIKGGAGPMTIDLLFSNNGTMPLIINGFNPDTDTFNIVETGCLRP